MNEPENVVDKAIRSVITVIVGLATIVMVQIYLNWTWHDDYEPWFLNSVYGMEVTEAAMFVVALLTALFQVSPVLRTAVSFSVGSYVGMIVYLAIIGGPGNLGPIVPIFGIIFIAPSVFLGAYIGHFLNQRLRIRASTTK